MRGQADEGIGFWVITNVQGSNTISPTPLEGEMHNPLALVFGTLLFVGANWVLGNVASWEPEDKSKPFLAATASKLEEAPQKYVGSLVRIYGADLSLAFREFESSDAGLAPFVTAQINGRGHVRGVETRFVFLIPKELQQNLHREYGTKKTIHADILVRVRSQTIPTRGGEIRHVGEIVKVEETEPK